MEGRSQVRIKGHRLTAPITIPLPDNGSITFEEGDYCFWNEAGTTFTFMHEAEFSAAYEVTA